MNPLTPLTYDEVYCNGRMKVNPRTGEIMECVVSSRPVFRAVAAVEHGGRKPRRKEPLPGSELWETEEMTAAMYDRLEARNAAARRRAANRAKRQVFDLAACNDFDTFITLTLSPDKINRYDYKAAARKLSQWLDNRVRRKGLRYLIVPEYHKDGAIHFHGLINAEAVKLSYSGKRDRKNGKAIYNVTDWKLGFTTAEKLTGEYTAVCHYISKYVTKQVVSTGPIGGRYYLHGGDLAVPVYKPFSCDFNALRGKGRELSIEEAGLTLVYLGKEDYVEFLDRNRTARGEAGRCGESGLVQDGGRAPEGAQSSAGTTAPVLPAYQESAVERRLDGLLPEPPAVFDVQRHYPRFEGSS